MYSEVTPYNTMEDVVEYLIKTCVEFHKPNINLYLDCNNLSDVFLTKMKSLCQGTNIELKKTMWI